MTTPHKEIEEPQVELAPEGTPLADFQKFRTEIMSEMLDNPLGYQIYRTSRFYAKLDAYFVAYADARAAEERTSIGDELCLITENTLATSILCSNKEDEHNIQNNILKPLNELIDRLTPTQGR